MQKLHVGIVAPQTYAVSFSSPVGGLDLSTVSAISIEIRKPDGSETSWSTAISGASATAATATHSFSAAPSELDQAGTWHLRAKMTVAGGYRWSEAWVEQVDLQHG